MARAMTITQLFDSIAIRIDGPSGGDRDLIDQWRFTDTGETFRMELSNGVLIHHPTTRDLPADTTVTLTKPQLLTLLANGSADGIDMAGDTSVISRLMAVTDEANPDFAIVTP